MILINTVARHGFVGLVDKSNQRYDLPSFFLMLLLWSRGVQKLS